MKLMILIGFVFISVNANSASREEVSQKAKAVADATVEAADATVEYSKQTVDSAKQALNDNSSELSDKIHKIKKSSGAAWKEMRKGISKAADNISESYQKAKQEYVKESK